MFVIKVDTIEAAVYVYVVDVNEVRLNVTPNLLKLLPLDVLNVTII
jgi:hypothetical protein